MPFSYGFTPHTRVYQLHTLCKKLFGLETFEFDKNLEDSTILIDVRRLVISALSFSICLLDITQAGGFAEAEDHAGKKTQLNENVSRLGCVVKYPTFRLCLDLFTMAYIDIT